MFEILTNNSTMARYGGDPYKNGEPVKGHDCLATQECDKGKREIGD